MSDALEMNPAFLVPHGVVYLPDGSRRRLPLPSTVARYHFEPGAIDPATRRAVVDAVQIVQRIAPWVSIAVGPRILATPVPGLAAQLLADRDGVSLCAYGGFCHYGSATIGIAAHDPAQVLRVATHEAWHAVDERLTDEAREIVDDGIRPALYGADCPYLSDPWERRARAFEAWCARSIHGLPEVYPSSPMEDLFNAAWSGRVGAEIVGEA